MSTADFRSSFPTALVVKAGDTRYHRPKFHAEFGVAEEEAHSPLEGLVQGLSRCRLLTKPIVAYPWLCKSSDGTLTVK